MRVCARVFQFLNQHVAEFHEIWYEDDVTGGHIKRTYLVA